jgi:lipid-binding SYLF domain-containing protein
MRHKCLFVTATSLVLIGTATAAISATEISTAEIKRLQNAAAVVRALRDQPDKGIPEKLWQKAACVVVIPDLKKGAFGIGGEYGRGVMDCRKDGHWGAPVFMELAKGSWGVQIGAAETDLVLLVMNREGAEKLLKNKVSLGADASIAAGPVGRAAAAATDVQMRAEIVSYSRSRGVFAGIDISGGVLGPDKDASTDVYGPNVDPAQIAFGSARPPAEAQPLLAELNRQAVATTGVK